MKRIILLLLIGYCATTKAQVGVNTTDPKAQLDIKSSNQATPANTDGILIPRVDAFPVTNPTVDQNGMMVYLTTDIGANLKGFYYWDNTASTWKSIGGDKGWELTGNSGTNPTTNFIGTTDDKPLKFRINNESAGLIETNDFNPNSIKNGITAFGFQSLSSNTTGYMNVANGYYALHSNTTGSSNVAIGASALEYNTTGYYNIASGYEALLYNTTGYDNIANGTFSLVRNTTGIKNIATGTQSLNNNTTGSANVAIGSKSLYHCVYGTGNGGYGEEANPTTTTGWNNIGIGYHTLGNMGNDYHNNYIISGNKIGYDNIAFGLAAGDRIGYNCNQSAFIGPFSNVIVDNTNVSNSTAIGNGALVFQNNMMRLGNSAVSRIEAQVGLTVVSDGRYKFNVEEKVKGLDFIKKLRPVMYQYDTEKMDREWMKTEFDTMAKHNPQILKDYKKSSQIRYSGFIAQEVEKAANELNYDFSGVSKPENDGGHYGLDYASFVVPIVKSVQEQQEEIESLKKKNEALEAQNNSLEQRLKAIEEKLSK